MLFRSEDAGLEELMFATGSDEKWQMALDFSREVMTRYQEARGER